MQAQRRPRADPRKRHLAQRCQAELPVQQTHAGRDDHERDGERRRCEPAGIEHRRGKTGHRRDPAGEPDEPGDTAVDARARG